MRLPTRVLYPLLDRIGRSAAADRRISTGSSGREGDPTLAVRGESLAAFDGRGILAGRVAPPSNTGRYSRSSRLAREAPRPSRCDARLSPRAARRAERAKKTLH